MDRHEQVWCCEVERLFDDDEGRYRWQVNAIDPVTLIEERVVVTWDSSKEPPHRFTCGAGCYLDAWACTHVSAVGYWQQAREKVRDDLLMDFVHAAVAAM